LPQFIKTKLLLFTTPILLKNGRSSINS